MYGLEFMDSCGWEFRAHDELYFQFQMAVPLVFGFDDMKVCHVKATFGIPSTSASSSTRHTFPAIKSVWEWTVEEDSGLWVPIHADSVALGGSSIKRSKGLSEEIKMIKKSGCKNKGCWRQRDQFGSITSISNQGSR